MASPRRAVGLPAGGKKLKVRDAWARKDLGSFAGGYSARVAWHGCVLLRVEG